MGADYYVYTEVKRKDNTWHALNGMYYNESTNSLVLSETYHSGSRTYFSRTYNKLRDIGTYLKISELSPEVLAKEDWLDPASDDDYVVSVSLNDLRNAIPKTSRHQCCGYVHKTQLWSYEMTGEDIDDYLSAEEYDCLSDAKKKEYEFYEWDDPMDWYIHLKEILAIINFQVAQYSDVNYMWNEPAEVRIVCIISY